MCSSLLFRIRFLSLFVDVSSPVDLRHSLCDALSSSISLRRSLTSSSSSSTIPSLSGSIRSQSNRWLVTFFVSVPVEISKGDDD
ncbi:hypothetical protein F2Q68_00011113 [Brassica cretica]|uniref:Secreted protein n=1 Tax=Brassica cretica TaxID=69181 RepID=A0A8S9KQ82_BRACR|nr:hypothetical protein F2Q68_00011113 [Brassica cretica]